MTVIVDAEDLDQAADKVREKYYNDDYLFEKLMDCFDDGVTRFSKLGEATKEDCNSFPHI